MLCVCVVVCVSLTCTPSLVSSIANATPLLPIQVTLRSSTALLLSCHAVPFDDAMRSAITVPLPDANPPTISSAMAAVDVRYIATAHPKYTKLAASAGSTEDNDTSHCDDAHNVNVKRAAAVRGSRVGAG